MADRQPGPALRPQRPGAPAPAPAPAPLPPHAGATLMRKIHERVPNSTQVLGFLTLVVSGGILLLLTGLTLTATVVGLIFFTPLVVLSSPIWVPAGVVLFVAAAGFLTACGFGVAALAMTSWAYRYVRGRHPPGSGRLDYARSRIVDTAGHVKDYAREYGGYLRGRVKDAAPGA
ncbi:hypothetical protein Taro_003127 [Colocasia esculenta]|uniref:Oleosin n=1 Tax=Colocasia esculenta TaxID=4460 RepID=A0A843TKR2_COLES|nr:hypothetical protein [Colocasia esculenta]